MQHFIEGFSVIFQMQYLLYMFGGVGIGLILGCLPGLTGSMGIALMLPFTAYGACFPAFYIHGRFVWRRSYGCYD